MTTGTIRPVPELAASSQPKQLPSARVPSDHLPIGALLSWEGAPEPAGSTRGDRTQRPAWQQLAVERVQPQKRQPPPATAKAGAAAVGKPPPVPSARGPSGSAGARANRRPT